MQCPHDHQTLLENGQSLYCQACEGRFLPQNLLGDNTFDFLKTNFKKLKKQKEMTCPGCQSLLVEISHGSLYLDVCSKCQGIWFDKNEFEHLNYYIERRFRTKPLIIGSSNHDEKNVQKLYAAYQKQKQHGNETSWTEAAFQLITSLPIERNLSPVNRPYMIIGLVLVNFAIFLLSIQKDLNHFLNLWAYIPGKNNLFPFAIYSSFLHGGWAHLLGNLYFLWVLGDNVEDVMGKAWLLSLYTVSGAVGFWASGIAGPENIPHVGASCSVAGIMAAYLLLFPKAKFVLRFFIFIVLPLSCFTYIGFWFGFQLFNLFVLKSAGVSWAGHVGGFIAGLSMTAIFKSLHQLGKTK